MLKKHFKKLILILTLVISFNIVAIPKRAEAFALTSAGIGLAIVLLAGAGVAISSQGMAQDLGSKLWDGLKSVVEVPQKVGDFVKTKITDIMIDFTIDWIKEGNIPNTTTSATLPLTFPLTFHQGFAGQGSTFNTHLGITLDTPIQDGQTVFLDYSINGIKKDKVKSLYNAGSYNPPVLEKIVFKFNGYSTIFAGPTISTSNFPLRFDLNNVPASNFTLTIDNVYAGSIPLAGKLTTDIPYDNTTASNVSKDKLTTELPIGSTVTYPQDVVKEFPYAPSKPVDTVTDIPNVKVDTTDIPTTDTGTITGAIEGIGSLLNTLISTITGIFVPPLDNLVPLDFTPFYFGLTDKFPFCVPFDLINVLKNMVAEREAPKFEVKFPEKYFNNYSFVIDFAKFDDYVVILRYFLLLSFVVFLILQTRKLIS